MSLRFSILEKLINKLLGGVRFLLPHKVNGAAVFGSNGYARIGEAHANSVHDTPFRRTSISTLVGFRYPTAIAWFVVAMIVVAFEGEPNWAFPQISEEVSEAVFPSVTDSDSPSAISRIVYASWLETAILHSEPRDVGSTSTLSVGFSSSVSATSGTPVCEFSTENQKLFPAVTHGVDAALLILPHEFCSNDNEFVKSFTCVPLQRVFAFSHLFTIKVLPD